MTAIVCSCISSALVFAMALKTFAIDNWDWVRLCVEKLAAICQRVSRAVNGSQEENKSNIRGDNERWRWEREKEKFYAGCDCINDFLFRPCFPALAGTVPTCVLAFLFDCTVSGCVNWNQSNSPLTSASCGRGRRKDQARQVEKNWSLVQVHTGTAQAQGKQNHSACVCPLRLLVETAGHRSQSTD